MTEEVKSISRLDQVEAMMMELPKVDCPLEHRFTPGLYSRTIFMPAGSLATSRIHKTEHQYIVSAGTVMVKINEDEWETISAPYIGTTKPGTRRLLFILEDCLWTTFHPVGIVPEDESEYEVLKAVDKVEDMIIEKHINEILGGELRLNELIKTLNS